VQREDGEMSRSRSRLHLYPASHDPVRAHFCTGK
jgi:hypothetical protein